MNDDILSRTLISPSALDRWKRAVERAAPLLKDLDPSEIPDEQGEVLDDGRLRIFCPLPNGKVVEEFIPPGEWTYNN